MTKLYVLIEIKNRDFSHIEAILPKSCLACVSSKTKVKKVLNQTFQGVDKLFVGGGFGEEYPLKRKTRSAAFSAAIKQLAVTHQAYLETGNDDGETEGVWIGLVMEK